MHFSTIVKTGPLMSIFCLPFLSVLLLPMSRSNVAEVVEVKNEVTGDYVDIDDAFFF